MAGAKAPADKAVGQCAADEHARQGTAHIAAPSQIGRIADRHGAENQARHSQVEHQHIEGGGPARRHQAKTLHQDADEQQDENRSQQGKNGEHGKTPHPTHSNPGQIDLIKQFPKRGQNLCASEAKCKRYL